MDTIRHHDALLHDPRRLRPREIVAGDRIECWEPVRAYDPDRNMWLPVPEGTWRLAWTSTAVTQQRDSWGRWTNAQGKLVHLFHVSVVEDEDFRAVPDDAGVYEIVLRVEPNTPPAL